MPAPGAGPENRRFTRVRPSGLVSKVAKVYADQKGAPLIDCNLIDISTGGACLETVGDATVPAKLVMVHGGVQKRGKVVWRKGRRFGVSF
jgi:hypothetical protein